MVGGIGGVAVSETLGALSNSCALRHFMTQQKHMLQLRHKQATTPPTIPLMMAVRVATALTRGAKSMGAMGAAVGLVLLIWGVDTVTGEPVTKATAVPRALL